MCSLTAICTRERRFTCAFRDDILSEVLVLVSKKTGEIQFLTDVQEENNIRVQHDDASWSFLFYLERSSCFTSLQSVRLYVLPFGRAHVFSQLSFCMSKRVVTSSPWQHHLRGNIVSVATSSPWHLHFGRHHASVPWFRTNWTCVNVFLYLCKDTWYHRFTQSERSHFKYHIWPDCLTLLFTLQPAHLSLVCLLPAHPCPVGFPSSADTQC